MPSKILLIDKDENFVFGFPELDVMFGRTSEAAVTHPYRDLVKPAVRFVQTTIRSIDPDRRRAETEVGAFHGDAVGAFEAEHSVPDRMVHHFLTRLDHDAGVLRARNEQRSGRVWSRRGR